VNEISGGLPVEFDVISLNKSLAAFQRRRGAMGWGLALAWDVGALLIVLRALVSLRAGAFTDTDLALVVAALAFALLFTLLGLRVVRNSRPGGNTVRLDLTGIEIEYSDGVAVRVSFSDPSLELELYDFSDHPELGARGSLHSIVVGRRETALGEGAYRAIYRRLDALGLIVRSARARSPFIPQSIQPVIHYVRGHASRWSNRSVPPGLRAAKRAGHPGGRTVLPPSLSPRTKPSGFALWTMVLRKWAMDHRVGPTGVACSGGEACVANRLPHKLGATNSAGGARVPRLG
jgi:hypothetical protein